MSQELAQILIILVYCHHKDMMSEGLQSRSIHILYHLRDRIKLNMIKCTSPCSVNTEKARIILIERWIERNIELFPGLQTCHVVRVPIGKLHEDWSMIFYLQVQIHYLLTQIFFPWLPYFDSLLDWFIKYLLNGY